MDERERTTGTPLNPSSLFGNEDGEFLNMGDEMIRRSDNTPLPLSSLFGNEDGEFLNMGDETIRRTDNIPLPLSSLFGNEDGEFLNIAYKRKRTDTPFTPSSFLCDEDGVAGERNRMGTLFTPSIFLCDEDGVAGERNRMGTLFSPSSHFCNEDGAFWNMAYERNRTETPFTPPNHISNLYGYHHFGILFTPDLLCQEDIKTSLNYELYEAQTYMGLNLDFVSEDEDEHVQNMVQRESSAGFGSKSFVTSSCDCSSTSQSWLETARLEGIAKIFEAREFFGFSNHTAYISVTYFDHFLSILPIIDDGELLAVRSLVVACLSLAAKMEERWKNRRDLSQLSDFQFEQEVTRKNVLIVLEVLEWKMTPITPFHYLHYFINKFCGEAIPEGLAPRVVQLIMAATKEINLMDHRPSIIAASAVLRAFDGQLTKEQFELKMNDVISLWGSIENEHIFSSYYMMENIAMGKVKTPKPPGGSSIHSSLIGVVESSSHTVAVRIKTKLDFFQQPDT